MEAVNSSISNVQFVRPGAATVSRGGVDTNTGARAGSTAGERSPGRIDVPFNRLNVTVNSRFDEAILEIRDAQTGDVEQQIPSTEELETQQRLQRAFEAEEAISQASLRGSGETAQNSRNSENESIRIRPGNSNDSAQVQLNQRNSTGEEATTRATQNTATQNADSGVTGQAVAALQAASNSSANTGGTGGGDQSAQVSVLA